MGRLVAAVGRRPRLTRTALALLVVLVAASILAPSPRPSHGSRPATLGSTRSLPVPSAPAGSLPLSRSELAQARRAAAQFLTGYVPFLYGRGSAVSIEGATPGLRLELSRIRSLVTPVERRRRPRVVSLTAAGHLRGGMSATALVADGGVTDYALRITLQAGRHGWLVSAVDDG